MVVVINVVRWWKGKLSLIDGLKNKGGEVFSCAARKTCMKFVAISSQFFMKKPAFIKHFH